ncbi:MAG: DUF4112 domain-containing protein [Bacteroidota bacterium]
METFPTETAPQLKSLDNFSTLLDSQFRIPGTNIRFGLDFLIGLIPYGGDVVTFIFSGLLVATMAKHGVGGKVAAMMLGNVLLDTLVGSVPVIGDLFDLGFKANRRNYRLLREHYHEGKHGGSALPIVLAVVLALVLMLAFTVFVAWRLAAWLFNF